MKLTALLLVLASANALAQASSYVNFVRQKQQGTGVVWDMPVAASGATPSALLLESGGALFQLWTIEQTMAKDYLLDQKLVGAYLPKADIKITTLDPYTNSNRTRVDQPFTVEILVDGLLTGSGLPQAASKVLLEQHIQGYSPGQTSLDPTTVAANIPRSTAFISQNGRTVLKFAASSLTAADPTKASGEEHFIVHALSDSGFSQSQIASGKVIVYPIASGAILGITPGAKYRYQLPQVQLNMNDLYPRSDTSFMLYEGTSVNGATGKLVKAFPWDDPKLTKTTILPSNELSSKITKDGIYTVALMSTTIYGTELLADPITFSVDRSLEVNAFQVNYSDGSTK